MSVLFNPISTHFCIVTVVLVLYPYRDKRLRKKRPGLITKGVLFLQDNARPHTAHRTTCTLQQLGWEVLPHPPSSPDLAQSVFHLFGPLKEFLGGQHFSTYDEVKQAVLGWFSRTDTSL